MSEETPGWEAIDAAFRGLYGDQEPLHCGPILHARLGGPDPLDGLSFFRATDPDHWHVVTYGFSELYQKESDDPETSGFGFEVTMRLARRAGEEPPGWAIGFLNNMARYVFRTGNRFSAGHHVDLNGPIALETGTEIRAIVFAEDPQLPPIETPNGRLEFLQVVGLTLEEFAVLKDWSPRGLLEVLARENPLWVLDLSRKSVLDDPEIAREVAARVEREGSSQNGTFVQSLGWKTQRRGSTLELTVGAVCVDDILRLLKGRIAHGREFFVAGTSGSILFRPADQSGWDLEDDQVTIDVTPALAAAMRASLKPARGSYQWPELAGFTLKIVPSEIKGQDGSVLRVIG